MKKPYQGHIERWHLTKYEGSIVIIGATGQETFIRTSAIRVLTPNMAETKNSIYSLGEMDRS